MRKMVVAQPIADIAGGDTAADTSVDDFSVLLGTLVAQVAMGDECAFRRLYELTVSRVYYLAYRITHRAELAEETVPEVYMQVWREAGRFDPSRASVLTWLLVICRSRALDGLRRGDRAQSVADVAQDAASDTPDCYPEQLLLLVERDNCLHAALSRLAPVHRQLIALAFMRGLSHHEIADWMNMPLGSIKTHLRKALQLLKADLAKRQKILTFHDA